jgi:hypothetical protein
MDNNNVISIVTHHRIFITLPLNNIYISNKITYILIIIIRRGRITTTIINISYIFENIVNATIRPLHKYIVMDLINALPGNSSVNTNTGNNRRESVFSMRSVPSKNMEL